MKRQALAIFFIVLALTAGAGAFLATQQSRFFCQRRF